MPTRKGEGPCSDRLSKYWKNKVPLTKSMELIGNKPLPRSQMKARKSKYLI